jgi:hypothetical protein
VRKTTSKSCVTSAIKKNAALKAPFGAKVLLLDIETSPILGYAWRPWDTSLIHIVKDWELMSIAWKWLHAKEMGCVSRAVVTEKELCDIIHLMLDQADLVVAHNGDRFDIKKIQAKLKEHQFAPPSPFKTVDTLKAARNHFAFTSNKLDDLCQKLKLGEKKESNKQLWIDCMAGDAKAWKKMEAYNKHDVVLLEKLYLELRPWMPRHPNMGVHTGSGEVSCGHCGSESVQSRGYYHTNTGTYHRLFCNSCRGWSRLRKAAAKNLTKTIVCDRR